MNQQFPKSAHARCCVNLSPRRWCRPCDFGFTPENQQVVCLDCASKAQAPKKDGSDVRFATVLPQFKDDEETCQV
eukprot:scaffold156280_cov19-Tisochrysis_lutea.AAC.2